ncbi:MAG TPA: DUF2892 domain-containing protein [Candidatus Thermoplasmatota archaeon]|nr:DUF2892 domain-containing protein [Candidatus Thermoplasmatota archaeon]
MSRFAPNVGPLDAIVRIVLGFSILVGAILFVRASDTDWALTLLIHPAILSAYLIMTAVARNDIAYHFLGWSTLRADRDERARHRMRLSPPRSS